MEEDRQRNCHPLRWFVLACAAVAVFFGASGDLSRQPLLEVPTGALETKGFTQLHAQPPWAVSRRLGQPSACQAIQVEVQPCDGGPCDQFLPSPSDCVWQQWSQWSACSCHGSRKRSREIKIPGDAGGRPCEGVAQEAQPCDAAQCARSASMDCLLGTWSQWSDCTKTCQGGQQYHTREIVRQQSGFGAFCSDSLRETRICAAAPCPGKAVVDCVWSQWSQWSTCTVTCGDGQKSRHRAVQTSPKNGGKLCQPLVSEEAATCGVPCGGFSVDCLFSQWTNWSPCSKTCDEGQTFRSRRVARESKAGGKGCRGYFEDYKSCSVIACAAGGKDCTFSQWSAWSDCSAPCNGHRSHNRAIASPAIAGGQLCRGPTMAMEPCNVDAPICGKESHDCQYTTWEAWSTCSRTCGGGMTTRKRSIAVHAQGVGKPCGGEMETVKSCSTVPCVGMVAVDCQWSEWSLWSACTLSCGGGQHRRHRTVIIEAAAAGDPCKAGDSIQIESCSTQPCLVRKFACDWASWGDWSACQRGGMSVNCGGGQRKRSRNTQLVKRYVKFDISQQASELQSRRLQGYAFAQAVPSPTPPPNEAVECKELQDDLEACAMNECDKLEPVDCAWGLWSQWSSCPCEGVRERHRVIASYAVAGGAPCEGSEVVTKQCHSQCNQTSAVDCVYSTWSAWGACPVTCGGSFAKRFRTVLRYQRGSGKQCVDGGERQQQKCNEFPCPVKKDCRWGDWSAYSACTTTCGGGQMSRSREVVQISEHGGKSCDKMDSIIVVACNAQPCPSNSRDCEFSTWGSWHACSQTCGIGTQHRNRVVMVDATEGGVACTGTMQDFKECNLGRCAPEPVIDCAWDRWSFWSACTALCNGHRERSRAIQVFAQHGGKPCSGSERDIEGCNVDSPVCKSDGPRDCILGQWQSWSTCTKRCETGQHYRTREVQVPSKNFGAPCVGEMQQVAPCNTGACPGNNRVDCSWKDWGQWSACTVTCNGGQKMRQRSIAVEAKSGGLPCQAGSTVELSPCNVQTCANAMEACGWAQWQRWEECSKSCGGGQQQRIRLRQWLPPAVADAKAGTQTVLGPAGVATPQRRLAAPAVLGGPDDCVGSQKEIRPCGIGPCDLSGPAPIPCQWQAWSDWGACTCEGFQERSRRVAIRPQNGGLVCIGPLQVSKACTPNCVSKSRDCSFGVWSAWSACTASCDGGQKLHSRALLAHAVGYGAACHGRLEEIQPCNAIPCSAPKDCKYGQWASWSSCSRTCNGGQKTRSRDIAQYPQSGGKPCENGALMEVIGCAEKSCTPWSPSDCTWSVWTNWHQCSATCGQGRQYRSRTIASMAAHNGKACKGRFQDYKDCKLPKCQKAPVDCTFLSWSDWSECFDTCAGHKERTRQIGSYAAGLGGRPCQGRLREVIPCAPSNGSAACSVSNGNADCQLGDWSLWSACTKTCAGGQHSRQRSIAQQARGSGQPCDTSLKITEACNTQACPGSNVLDCIWGPWGAFSDCSASCGGGQMRRHRSIMHEAKNGGRPCSPGGTLELRPCKMDPCNGGGYCNWATWSTWQECSSTCGAGQKKRRRDLVHSALPSPSNLAIALPERISFDSNDPFTNFAVRHERAVCAFAILGIASMLLFLGLFVTPLAQRAAQWRSWMGQRTFMSDRSRGIIRYSALDTEEADSSNVEHDDTESVELF